MAYQFDSKKHKVSNVNLYINTVCNLSCGMCRFNEYIKPQKSPIPFTKIKRFMRQYKEYNPQGLIELDSGEIYANRKEMKPYIALCKDLGIKFGIITNGTTLSEEDLREDKEAYAYIVVSLDSTEADVHDSIRGKGTFAKAVAFLELLNQQGIPYSINTVISKLNIDNLTELYDLLVQGKYFRNHLFNLLRKSFYTNEPHDAFYDKNALLSQEEQEYAIQRLKAYLDHTQGIKTDYTPEVHNSFTDLLYKNPGERLKKPMCNIFERKIVIGFNGDLRLCHNPGFPALGNIMDEDFNFRDIWENEKTQGQRRVMAECLKICGIEICNNKAMSINQLK